MRLSDDVTVSVLPVAALVRVVAHGDARSPATSASATSASRTRNGSTRFGELRRCTSRRSTPEAARAPASREQPGVHAATAARSCTCSRRPRAPLLYQDTSGHWSGILPGGDFRPDVAILAAAGRGNIDGEPIQGSLAEFVARQAVARAAARGRPVAPRRLAARVLGGDRHRARSASTCRAGSRRPSSPTSATSTATTSSPERPASRKPGSLAAPDAQQRVDLGVAVTRFGEDLARWVPPRTGPDRIEVGVSPNVTGWRSTCTGRPSSPSTTCSRSRWRTCGSANTSSTA